jgi:hypothetical protein
MELKSREVPPVPVDTASQRLPEPQQPPAEVIDTLGTDPLDPTTTTDPDTGRIDIDNYFFQSEFDAVTNPMSEIPADTNGEAAKMIREEDGSIRFVSPHSEELSPIRRRPVRFINNRMLPYRPRFRSGAITTSMDNSLLFGGMQSFAATPSYNFGFPPLGILLKTTITDVFEDYRFEIGARIPTTFNGMEYFMTFDDLRHRIDKRIAIYRQNTANFFDDPSGQSGLPAQVFPLRMKTITHLVQGELRYPFDIFRSLRATLTARDDKLIVQSRENVSLNIPTYTEQRLGLRLEYVFDNVLFPMPNLPNGTRYKAYAEVYNRFSANLANGGRFDPYLGLMGVVGADARHYLRIDRLSILALRAAGASSFGSERMLFFAGGMENLLTYNFDPTLGTPENSSFAYQTLAANLRGFQTNVRNGSSYVLLNAEVRVPLFNYFSMRPIKSALLRNFQLTGFFDAGTAWHGASPFSRDNPLNTVIIEDPNSPVRVKVNYFRQPVLYGFGFGLRSVIFGYFFKFDYAWGVESGVLQKPMAHFSIGYDF